MPKKHQLVALSITPFPSGSIRRNILGLRNRKRADLFLVCWCQTPSSLRARPGAGLPTETAAAFFSPFIHPLIHQMFSILTYGAGLLCQSPWDSAISPLCQWWSCSHWKAPGQALSTECLTLVYFAHFWDPLLRHTAASPSSEIHQLLLAARSWYVPSVSNARFLETAITHFNK